MNKDLVMIVRAKGYEEMPDALRKGIEATADFRSLKGKRIGIKPNLCASKSSYCGATTDVRMVRELIGMLNKETDASCEIFIFESNGEGINADYAFDCLGYRSLEDEFSNVRLVNLSKDRKTRIALKNSEAFDMLDIAATTLEIEYLISVAKLKTHVDERISCILKNQFGMIPRKQKAFFHPILSEVLCDLNRLYEPDLCVVDGITGMEGFGPTQGSPKCVNAILVGTNSMATDIVAAKIMGFKPRQVPHLKKTMKVNRYSESDFSLVGEDLSTVSCKFRFIPFRHYLTARIGLRLQKWSLYTSNFGGFLQKMRSALATIGVGEVSKKVAFRDILEIAEIMIWRVTG